MTVDNVTSIDEAETKLRQGYADMATLCHDNFNAAMAASQAAISGFQAVNAELLAFFQSRAKDSLATGQRLAECGSPEMAIEVQLDYTKFALQAYVYEVGKLNELTGRVLVDVLAPLESRADVVTRQTRAALAA
jgi:hypothetical protein